MKSIEEIAGSIKPGDMSYLRKARKHLDFLTKLRGSLGRLEEVAAQMVAIRKDLQPKFDRKVIFTFAGDHGVTMEGVSVFPSEVTPQMVFNFLGEGLRIRGHKFHYSEMTPPGQTSRTYLVADYKKDNQIEEGFLYKNTLASYIPLHFGSNNKFAEGFINKCRLTTASNISSN